MILPRNFSGFVVTAVFAVSGCVRSGAPATDTSRAYEGQCSLFALKETPIIEGLNSDAISLVAEYHFNGPGVPATGQDHVSLAFQVSRTRLHDLRTHLQQHPIVFCRPESASSAQVGAQPSPYQLAVPPFEGQRGVVVP